jgi:glycine/D-amino acid oxidase-like deaminating enzyme/nitrite reductase/ring-hydroxylating ferredoxin subunit
MDHVTTHPSLWLDRSADPDRASIVRAPALRTDLDVDVCVVGGGVTGLTTALLLSRAGRRVVVVDALVVGGGETGRTTAHLAVHHDLYFRDVISRFGEDDAHLVLASRRAAIARIESIIAEGAIECGFARVPAYLYSETTAGVAELRDELVACGRIGVDASWSEHPPIPGPVQGAIHFPDQAELQPISYLAGLVELLRREGVEVYEHTRVESIDEGSPARVRAGSATITARDVVLATTAPVGMHAVLYTKIAAYRTYAIAAEIDPVAAPRALLWDDGDPYHYVRSHHSGGRTFLIVGGEDHKTGQGGEDDARWRALEEWTRARWPIGAVVDRWSGQVLEPADGLPYIGAERPGIWIATGFSGDGMTNGTIAAEVLAAEISGARTAGSRLYDATRFKPIASAKEFVREAIDYPAHLVADRLRKPEAERAADVACGDGKLVRLGRERVAVHRDDGGAVHAFSPVCPHMGCHVHWNGAERSWDCPCHGSRFDAKTGEPLNGPATRGLVARPLEERTEAHDERSSHA